MRLARNACLMFETPAIRRVWITSWKSKHFYFGNKKGADTLHDCVNKNFFIDDSSFFFFQEKMSTYFCCNNFHTHCPFLLTDMYKMLFQWKKMKKNINWNSNFFYLDDIMATELLNQYGGVKWFAVIPVVPPLSVFLYLPLPILVEILRIFGLVILSIKKCCQVFLRFFMCR